MNTENGRLILTHENMPRPDSGSEGRSPLQPTSAEPAQPKSALLKYLPIAVIATATAIFIMSGAYRYLSLDALREHYTTLEAFVEKRFVLAILIFAVAYIVAVALSLPGATILSLLGGFLFGTVVGTGVVVVAATIGATIIFIAAKTAFGDALRARAGGVVKKMEEGFRSNAMSYLLLLRLIPLFPFFVVNVAPALFGVPVRTFFIATVIGIIPGTFAYVSAGNGLGAVLAAGGDLKLSGLLLKPEILTPIVALSFVALLPVVLKAFGVFPGAKKAADAR